LPRSFLKLKDKLFVWKNELERKEKLGFRGLGVRIFFLKNFLISGGVILQEKALLGKELVFINIY